MVSRSSVARVKELTGVSSRTKPPKADWPRAIVLLAGLSFIEVDLKQLSRA
jgi:hypothetical protein